MQTKLHPEAASVQRLIDEMEGAGSPTKSLKDLRDSVSKRTRRLAMSPPHVERIVDFGGVGPENTPVRVYYPSAEKLFPVLVYFHGGGFVAGGIDMVEAICSSISREAGVAVASVNYRLAPENKYPAAIEDSLGVMEWLCKEGAGIGLDCQRIILAGDSAGGNIAAVTAQESVHRKDIRIIYQVLAYPVLDFTMSHASYDHFGTGYSLTAEKMRWYASQYLPDGELADEPRISPLFGQELYRLPATLLVLAGFDPLVDEGRAYAGKLKNAGVAAEVMEVPKFSHGFLGWTAESCVARDVLCEIGRRVGGAVRAAI